MKTLLTLLIPLLALASCQSQPASVKILDQKILPHPRLLFTGQEMENVKQLIASEPLVGELYATLLREADKLLDAPLQKMELRETDAVRMPNGSRQYTRSITLGMAYRLTGDKRYAQKVEEDIREVCNYPNWNPQHYLDVSAMTIGVAIAYDWLYDYFSDETKQLAVEAIKTKALDLALYEYENGDRGSWAKRETNWNIVCNSGMVLGALAIAAEYPVEAAKVIDNAVQYVPNCLNTYMPDGVCYEGPSYWSYTNIFLTLLLKALNDNFGHDFGLSEIEGFSRTALWYIHSVSPAGKVFNYANSSGTSPDVSPTYFFYSKHFRQPEVAAFFRDQLPARLKRSGFSESFFLSIPWFDNTPFDSKAPLPKLQVYKGINDIVVFNGNKNTSDFIYLIAKSGDPTKAHQHLDVGSFVVETNGIRWGDDLGSDTYSVPGAWEYGPDGRRWNYFRNSSLGHNTLSIDGKIQYSPGVANVAAYDDKATQPYATIDMSTSYEGQAKSVRRTFRLIDDATMVVVDSVELLSSSQTLRWSMVTNAAIECKGNVATLTREGKQFFLQINNPSSASFAVTEAKAFTEHERPVTGYQLLTVSVKGNSNQVIEIQMSSNAALAR